MVISGKHEVAVLPGKKELTDLIHKLTVGMAKEPSKEESFTSLSNV